jgi:hypothetical protein
MPLAAVTIVIGLSMDRSMMSKHMSTEVPPRRGAQNIGFRFFVRVRAMVTSARRFDRLSSG